MLVFYLVVIIFVWFFCILLNFEGFFWSEKISMGSKSIVTFKFTSIIYFTLKLTTYKNINSEKNPTKANTALDCIENRAIQQIK